ncbi:MAG: cell division protein FtsA [Tannerella sp.]|jgi:cell division protein FtsA|nr:cell division protein FtsA [Tannerella sp.]
MTQYIAAIDLGTSHITGVVGKKNSDGTFLISAAETMPTPGCIVRGNITNLGVTADSIVKITDKLEAHLGDGFTINSYYVGAGGQSLQTVDYTVSKEIAADATVTQQDIDDLEELCRLYKIQKKNFQLIDAIKTVYYADGNKVSNPIDVSCLKLEARYKLVIGDERILPNIGKTFKDRASKEVAGVLITPLTLADAMMSDDEKKLGCALVSFGAGVTTVTVYKENVLLGISVIPFGGNDITNDISAVEQLTDTVSEKLKTQNGSVLNPDIENAQPITVEMEGATPEISPNDLNAIIEGRAREIIHNVRAGIAAMIDPKALSSGIIITGGGAELENIAQLVKEICGAKTRLSAIRSNYFNTGDDTRLGNLVYMPAISIMLKGTENCVVAPVVVEEKPVVAIEPQTSSEVVISPHFDKKDTPKQPKWTEKKSKKEKKKPWWGMKDLFADVLDEEKEGDNEQKY